MTRWIKWTFLLLLLALVTGLGWALVTKLGRSGDAPAGSRTTGPIPVEVAPVTLGKITQRRTFSGALEAYETIVVAPKVAGRITKLRVDLADPVKRGQVVVELDNAEFVQAIAQATAEQAVADARVREAEKALLIARKQIERIQSMKDRGLSADVDLETAQIDLLRAEAALDVAQAESKRATASLETARIREGYTRVTCDWNDETIRIDGGSGFRRRLTFFTSLSTGIALWKDTFRVVGERLVNEGETVSANTPLIRVVRLNPMQGVLFATERDYGDLRVGQRIDAVTDAHPGRHFAGTIRRIAPVFRQNSRQARVELQLDNDDEALKPGMFVRVTIALREAENASIVPELALTSRNEQPGVFLLTGDGKNVTWRPVAVGLEEGAFVQVIPQDLEEKGPIVGRVVTLGQQLLEDGAQIAVPSTTQTQATP
ncbi:MAG: efflux RND transporter periplasmic adaptor subunit [Planctomycetes bacterium]|nr:efflux RND transporter periplasmic adaptor subunit [Planctomycetota bacterium]